MCNRAAQRVGMHVVDEAPPPVDLDDRDPLAVLRLEPGSPSIATSRNSKPSSSRAAHDDAPGRLAQMAAGGGVEATSVTGRCPA